MKENMIAKNLERSPIGFLQGSVKSNVSLSEIIVLLGSDTLWKLGLCLAASDNFECYGEISIPAKYYVKQKSTSSILVYEFPLWVVLEEEDRILVEKVFLYKKCRLAVDFCYQTLSDRIGIFQIVMEE